MHVNIERIKTQFFLTIDQYRRDLARVIDVLGKYAPFFLAAAVANGVGVVVGLWYATAGLNALLGARGIGTITSELSSTIWTVIIALVIIFIGQMILARLQGKYRETLLLLRDGVIIFSLLFLLTPALYALIIALFAPSFLIIFRSQKIVQYVIALLTLAVTLQLFFASITSIVLRVTSMGSALRIALAMAVVSSIVCKYAFLPSSQERV